MLTSLLLERRLPGSPTRNYGETSPAPIAPPKKEEKKEDGE
jgi:hypothetical protein